MIWTREPDPEHQRLLSLIAPNNGHTSWLHLVWEPGDVWEPLHRWVIYQMRPATKIRPDILAALRGPHPRSTGHYCAPGWCECALKSNGWRGGATKLIDRQQWQLYRDTGCYGKRWWVIQGRHGGHKFQLDKTESKISKLNGGPEDTPAIGDLPYAEFDMRTFWKVAAMDKLRVHKLLIGYCDRKHDQMDQEEQDAKVEAQAQVWNWLKSQTEQTYEGISRKDWSEFYNAVPVAPGYKDDTDYEAVEKEFVTNPN